MGSGRKVTNISVKRSSTGWERNNAKVKSHWVHLAPGYVYLSFRCCRAYWIFRNIAKHPLVRMPKLKFSDRTQTVWINSFGIRFDYAKDYKYACKCLSDYVR